MGEANRPVMITGIGLLSALGEGTEAHWQALNDAKPLNFDDSRFAPYSVHGLGEVDWSQQISRRDMRQMEPWQQIGTYAAGLALDDAGVPTEDHTYWQGFAPRTAAGLRFETKQPGAKNRTSIFLRRVTPGTSGQTSGRSSSETKARAGSGRPEVKGSSSMSSGGASARRNSSANARLGTANLSPAIGSPPSQTWNVPLVVRRSCLGLWSTPFRSR